MTFLILAGTLMLATVLMVRPALVDGPPLVLQGFNGAGVVLGFTCFVAIAVVMDPLFSFALLLALLLHEFGHVIAHRMVGHEDARFRLIPFWNGARISDEPPTTDADAFFIALMGPGISLAPMVLSFALAPALSTSSPLASEFFLQFALATGALNFVNLLPIWPLDGGRCVRLLVQARAPRFGPLAAAAMAAALLGFAMTVQSVLLTLLALVGGFALITNRAEPAPRPSLSPRQWRVAATAWFASLSAFFLGGWWVIKLIPLS
jgi:Zn-dependent protease